MTPPSLAEVQRAIKQMSSGKDGIPAELYKAHGEEALQAVLHAVLTSIWEEEDMKKKTTTVAHVKFETTKAEQKPTMEEQAELSKRAQRGW